MVRLKTGGGKKVSANAILTKDIIVNEGVLDAVNKDLVSEKDFIEWEPIGKSDYTSDAYTGTFDGHRDTPSADCISMILKHLMLACLAA